MRALLVSLSLLASSALACSPLRVRPAVLDVASAESQTPASREAAELSPVTYAEAEKLRRDAEAAQKDGDSSAAQILGEQALAAYSLAFLQARAVRAARALDEARQPADATAADLARLKDEQQRTAAELADLETRIKVAREAMPLSASGPADASREAARREAARALETEARLLCVSTRLLSPDSEGLKEAETGLQELHTALDDRRAAAPIDAALRARARCLETLSAARRKAEVTPATAGDALLAELGRQGSFTPVREDRGVVVTLHDVFTGDALSPRATEALEVLGRVAAAHPALPVVLVLHDAEAPRGAAQQRDARRLSAARQALARHRAERLETVEAGASRPLVDPRSAKDRVRNDRLEVVFVDAGG